MQRFTHWILALAAGLAAIGVVGCSPAAKKERHMTRADRYFDSGQYDKAEVEYMNVLRIDSQNARAIGRLGMLYLDQGRLGRAIPFLLKAREFEPDDLELRIKASYVYLAAGRLEEVRNEANLVLDRKPQDDDAPLLLAEVSVTPREIERTRRRLQTLPPPAVERAPVQVALGILSLRQRDFKAAEAAFEHAKTLDPKSSAAHLALGNLYWVQNDLNRADQAFQTAAELAPLRSQTRLRYVHFKSQTGDLPAGKRILEEMSQKTPDYLPVWIGLAEIAASEKKYDECLVLINKMLARDPGSYDALMLKGRVHLAMSEVDKAVMTFEGLIKTYPQSAPVHYHLALAYLIGNEMNKAIASLDKTLTLDPNSAEALLLSAQLKIRSGDLNAAVAALKQLVQQRPEFTQAQLLLADTYRAQGNLDDALNVCRQLQKSFPKNPRVALLTGSILLQQKKTDDARQAFETALALAPDSLSALDQLVDLDLAEKQYQPALQRVEKQIEKSPALTELRLLQAKVFLAQRDTTQAETALKKALELQPDFSAAFLMLGRLYVNSGQHQKALDSLNAVVAKNPSQAGAWMLIGMIHDQQKNYEAAREAYEKVLALDPKFSPALNNLAYLYSEHLGQLDKAYETARTAKELLPTDPATADTFGWILYKRGQYPWALSLLQESAEKLSSEPEVQFHLGMAYYMMGEEEPARIALQRALQVNKEFRGKEEAAKSLTVLSYNVETAGTEARVELERRLAERPDDPVALARLAIIHERARDIAKASDAYKTILKNNPRNVRALENAARLSATRPEDAKQILELAKDAYKLAPDDPRIAYVLGRLAYQTGDFQWAANLLQETARKQPATAEAQYDLAQALYSVGRIQDAESAMRTALQLDSSFPQAGDAKRFLKMVALHANPTQALAAESEVDQVLKSDPGYVPALMVAAAINEQKPNTALAKQLYEKVLSRYPDFVPALKRLAVLYSEDPANNQKAYDLATQARKALPNDPELARTLGIIAYRQGDYARSTRLLQESATKGMDDAQLMYYLGMSQYQLKEPAKSKQALQRALKLELPDKLAAEARRILAELK